MTRPSAPKLSGPPEGSRAPHRKVYGRRKGKALRASQERLIDEVLPRLRVPGVAREGAPGRAPVDPEALFGRVAPLWLEIGFGGGEHLAAQAAAHPEVALIGCEPFVNGVAMALGRIEIAGLKNVRIHPSDARDLIELLPPESLSRVFLLYPDPWPKARHHNRRFVNAENLGMLRRAMRHGAELRLATDIPDYVDHACAAVTDARGFTLVEPPAPDWSRPWPGWPGTRYEAKAVKAGRRPHYLTIRRD
jgi:tRNA (guanine-N7-)-methyltransferase